MPADKLVRILDRDLIAAGIARRVESTPGKWKIDKRDERGRTVDVHALRHTFGTLLSKNGVKPRTAQAAMRHFKIDLTMNVYTDPKLLDVAAAMEASPNPPLGKGSRPESFAVSATGTDGLPPSDACTLLVPVLVRTTGKPCILESITDKATTDRGEDGKAGTVDVNAYPVNENNPLTNAVNGLLDVGDTRLEQGPKSSKNTGVLPQGAAESGAVGETGRSDDFAYLRARWPGMTDEAIQQFVLAIRSVQFAGPKNL